MTDLYGEWQQVGNGHYRQERQLIGRVVATERQPNTAFQFHFWATPDSPVGIGTLVVVHTPQRTVWGVVVEGLGYNDVASPMFDYLGADGDPQAIAPTTRPEIRVYTAAVLRHEPEQPIQPVPIGPVYLATEQDVLIALRIDAIPEERRIPIGIYQSGNLKAPVYLDADFLLGPEAGHLNVTGTSGLAAKTSAIQFLVSAIFQKVQRSVAAVCFNVKGGDLLFVDQSPVHQLSEEDLEIYRLLGVEPKPFPRVEYYAPFKPDRVNLATLRTNPGLRGTVKPLCWGLQEVMRYVEVLLNRDDVDVKADAFLQFLRQRVIEPGRFRFDEEEAAFMREMELPIELRVTNFTELVRWFDQVLCYMERTNKRAWRSFALETIRKLQNRLVNLTTRFAGLVAESDVVYDLPWGQFQDRTLYVIDVANLSAEAQDLIFTRVIAELRERMERRQLGVETVIVIVDELNRYAPVNASETYVMRTLRDICARGRYLGLVLFGAQQFRSQVDKQIIGNASTSLYGRIEMEEMAQPGYQIFSPAVKEKMGALSPGEVLVRHPYFTQPIFVRFPRPALMRGQDGLQRYQPEPDLPLEDAVWRSLQELDPAITRNAVADIIARTCDIDGKPNHQAVVDALNRVRVERPPAGEVLSRFERLIPQRPTVRTIPDDLPPPPATGDLLADLSDGADWSDELDEDDPFR